jgi:hypothetical protein
MSDVPEGAQISDDGQWWWDGENWQPIDPGGGGGWGDGGGDGGGGDGGGGEQPAPAFDFDNNGLLVSAENSPVYSEGEPLKVSFSVCNVGTGPGSAHVTLYIDGSDTGIVWDSPELQPGYCTAPDDGYLHDVPAQTEGRHLFEIFADPAGPNGGRTSNDIDVGPPEG